MNQIKTECKINFNNQITKLYCYDQPQFLKQLKPVLNQLNLEQIDLDFNYKKDRTRYDQSKIAWIMKTEHIGQANFGDDYYIKKFKLIFQDLKIITSNRNNLINAHLITNLLELQNQLNQAIIYDCDNNNLVFYQSQTTIGRDDLNYDHCYYDGKLILKLGLPIPLDQLQQNQIKHLLKLCQDLQAEIVIPNRVGLKQYQQSHLQTKLADDALGIRIQFSFDPKQQVLNATQYVDFEHDDGYVVSSEDDYFANLKSNSRLQAIRKLSDFDWKFTKSKQNTR